jgi:hypothetical protein
LSFFREFPLSGFQQITGDMGDSRYSLALLEYWRLFFGGRAAFGSPGFFYPVRGVLGFSDGMFLLGVPYSAFRLVIADRYLAYELTVAFLQVIGFISLYLLLRQWLGIGRVTSGFGAFLFGVSNVYFNSAYSVQFRAVNFVPLILLLLVSGAKMRTVRPRLTILRWSAGAAIWALLFFTGFYIAWFFSLAAILAAATWAVLRIRWISGPPAGLKDGALLAILPAVTFLLFLVPFAIVYVPALKQTGARAYDLALLFCPQLIDLVNVGGNNLLWGGAVKAVLAGLQNRPNYWEFERGWPMFMMAVFLLTGTLAVIKILRAPKASTRTERVTSVVFLAVLMCWLMELKWWGHSLWLIAYFIPGGNAIRAPVRFNVLLNLGVVIVCSVGVDWLVRLSTIRKGLLHGAVALLCAALALEQVNTVQSHLVNRRSEEQSLGRVPPPPAVCRSFYVAPGKGRPVLWTNIDAMHISERLQLPTINGYSGWFPQGWDLLAEGPAYQVAVTHWASVNGLIPGLCVLDADTRAWQPFEIQPADYYRLGEQIDFRRGGSSARYVADGWGDEEPGGRWTIGEAAGIVVPLRTAAEGRTRLRIQCGGGFNPGASSDSTLTAEVNGHRILHSVIPQYQPIEFDIILDPGLLHAGVNSIRLLTPNPKRPSDYGSPDTRTLGIAVQTVSIEDAD